MRRDEDKKQARAEFVQMYINEYNGKTECAVRELADKLFLSERTIWRDLTDTTETQGEKPCKK
jgi:DeoR/GlpR family transcriptional regulator of sugar metabolism